MSNKAVADGLIIRSYALGNDKILTVLTKDGRISIIAKGATTPRSKLLAATNLFSYGNFEFYEKNGKKWLSNGSIKEKFSGVYNDIQSLALASYIVELAVEISGEECEASELLAMTLNTLYVIANRLKPVDVIKAVYELFAVDISGFAPDLSGCIRCGGTEGNGFWLDVMNGGIICERCMSRSGGIENTAELDPLDTRNILLPIDASSLSAMRYCFRALPKRKFAFELSGGESLAKFTRACEVYLVNHLEKCISPLEFYRKM
ncbi:MAG: DNA repair protein RecO [Clostridia bacterium]|jgi:DNA repair protein RecO (recombination protein O)|nr:DNA repair protein RecO [Clostridia bacterium]